MGAVVIRQGDDVLADALTVRNRLAASQHGTEGTALPHLDLTGCFSAGASHGQLGVLPHTVDVLVV